MTTFELTQEELDYVYKAQIEWRGIVGTKRHALAYYGDVDLVDEPKDSAEWFAQRGIREMGADTTIPKSVFESNIGRCEYCDTKHSALDKRCSFCGGKI